MKRLASFGLLVFALVALMYPSDPQGQTYTVTPSPFQTAFSNAGVIINNACIWTYIAGTTTAVTTYSDNIGTQNTNPIRSDSAGRFTAFLVVGSSYKFVYESACTPPAHGTVLRTADTITAMPSNSTTVDVTGTAGENLSANVPVYLSDGSGAKTQGSWYRTDTTNPYSSSLNTVGFTTAACTSASTTCNIRLHGNLGGFTGLTAGALYYTSVTGVFTTSTPSNARRLGQADTTTSLDIGASAQVVTSAGLPGTSATDGNILVGRTSDHTLVLSSLSAGPGVTISNSGGNIMVSTGSFGHTQVGPSSPSGTTDNTGKMMGLAGAITPKVTGTVLFCMGGTQANDTTPDGSFVQMTYGTGTAPANAAALTGTAIGPIETQSIVATNAQRNSFGGCALVTGLTLNTAVWYDVRLGALSGGTATVTSVVITAVELP